MVLVEVLNFFAGGKPDVRTTVSSFIGELHSNKDCPVIPQTSEQFSAALRLYQQRSDKHWSLTDCASMLIMQREGIQEILSKDRHFRQAGFVTLLD